MNRQQTIYLPQCAGDNLNPTYFSILTDNVKKAIPILKFKAQVWH